jgi:predicted lactoylglutathione lyase
MIDHVVLHVSDIEKSKQFYAAALKPVGYVLTGEHPEWSLISFGVGDKNDLWVVGGGADKPAVHVGFRAESREAVDQFHAAALAAGGKDNGAPGYRADYSPGYYAAFVYDPDEHNIEVIFYDPNPTAVAKRPPHMAGGLDYG